MHLGSSLELHLNTMRERERDSNDVATPYKFLFLNSYGILLIRIYCMLEAKVKDKR